MNIANRVLTRSGAWLKSNARSLAEKLFKNENSRYMRSRRVIDGYMVEGGRAGGVGSATVMDFPALLCLPGYYSDPVYSALTTNYSIVLSLPRGRDSYLDDVFESPIVVGEKELLASTYFSAMTAGDYVATDYRYSVSGERGEALDGYGCGRGYTVVFTETSHPENTLAYVTRNLPSLFMVSIQSPTFFRLRYLLDDPAVAIPVPASPSASAKLSFAISDSIMTSEFGAYAFSKPLAAPSYPTEPHATTFYEAQAPWSAFSLLPTDEGYDVCLSAHAVFDMFDDSDKFGARGLWIGLFHVTQVDDVPAVALFAQHAINSLDNGAGRKPIKSSITERYKYNAHLRLKPVRLSDGTIIVADPFIVQVEDESRRYSLDVHRITGDSIAHEVVVSGALLNSDASQTAVIGIDADDHGTAVLIAFSAARSGPTPIFVYQITASDTTLALTTSTAFRQNLSTCADSEYSAGRRPNAIDPDTGLTYISGWESLGAGGDQVKYIGNGKWAFYVSANILATSPARGDWALAIYDITENAVALAGIIDSDLLAQGPLDAGAMDCVRHEVADDSGEIVHKATIIASRGGNGQYVGRGDVSDGQTYISYDSGETWARIASVGSPAGAFHCGNALAARSSPVVRI